MIEISDTLQTIVPGIPIIRIVKYDMPKKPLLRRKTCNIHFCGFCEEQFLHSSSLCKHKSKVHAIEYEKSINSYYPLVNELSDPQMQNVLESMSQQIVGIENFELLLDPIQKVIFVIGINFKNNN
jgi:hypothetical protein